MQPDILFFFSDQHHAGYSGFSGNDTVETPALDRLAGDGTVFRSAYTSCPLCVPARSSMLSGQLPANTGIYTNGGRLRSDQATFLHSLGAEGYETVLCGRMHFKGPDQRHGFTRRITGDVTQMENGIDDGWSTELGPYAGGPLGMGGCVDILGGGNSPVLEYDRAVIRAALDYLEKEHDKPQCLVVGTYGPHFPYVAPPRLYQRYMDQVDVPGSWYDEGDCRHPLTEQKKQRIRTPRDSGEEVDVTPDDVRAARAAYFGMITQLDRQIGQVREAWEDYLNRNEREGLFIYSSDHGDTCGEHGVFGKQTFFEGSAGIPLIFEGSGVKPGQDIDSPASIMDIGPTLCELVGATAPPAQDGRSLAACLRGKEEDRDRYVLSEFMESRDGRLAPGRMIRHRNWKYITYAHEAHDGLLFDLDHDPEEVNDLSATRPEVVAQLHEWATENWRPEQLAEKFTERQRHQSLIAQAPTNPLIPQNERLRVPESARRLPEIR
ncbi:MAG: sulfatase-like hydrolase/transferase [Candidatus Brocadiia bacterium]